MSIYEAELKIKEYRSQHALSAASSAQKVLDYIQYGKESKVLEHYEYITRAGDWEACRGVEEVIQILERQDLIIEPLKEELINIEVDEEFDISYLNKEVDLYVKLEGHKTYKLTFVPSEEQEELIFDIMIKNQFKENIDIGFKEKEEFEFYVDENNEGICHIHLSFNRHPDEEKVIITEI